MQTYVVGFKIWDARSLQTEDNLNCDPFATVECCGRTYQTETLVNKSQIVVWNESSIWPDIELHPKEFETGVIEFTLYSRYWFTRNYVIGKASLQLSSINRRQSHVYARKWLVLRRDDSPEPCGMVNVTVFCLMPGEPAPSQTEQETPAEEGPEDGAEGGGEDYEDLTKAVLGSTVDAPQGKAHMVQIDVHRVEDLAPTASGYTPSPFITVEFVGCVVKTAYARDVTQFQFNESAQIPVTTPLCEDTIMVKLWHNNWVSADELLAQGLISFSELRNTSLSPRWFNLYGWNLQENPDLASIQATGETVEPNYFKGRMLISGRVLRLDDDEPQKPAKMCQSNRVPEEPGQRPVALLSDVYMVAGADGREVMVEISFGTKFVRSGWQVYDGGRVVQAESKAEEQGPDEQNAAVELVEGVTTFSFPQKVGRLEPLLVMTPELSRDQPYVMINIYKRELLSGECRIGYAKRSLNEFYNYEPGAPRKPKFFSMSAMPNFATGRSPCSVLITIEQNLTDDLLRHNRKNIKPLVYIVRAYCFMARNISSTTDEAGYYGLRIACAGLSKTTEVVNDVRPDWMQMVPLKVILTTDSPKDAPTMEPITLTIFDRGRGGDYDLGKTVCTYTYMRKKDALQKWEPFNLKPQWIKLSGGAYGGKTAAEVLVAFELLMHKDRDVPKLTERVMWPISEDRFDAQEHFCKMRRATLHFSLHGLRDLKPLPRSGGLGSTAIGRPVIEVEVPKLADKDDLQYEPSKPHCFDYRKTVPWGDERMKEDNCKTWETTVNGVKHMNYEFLQVAKMCIEIPDTTLLEPHIRLRVREKPSDTWIGGLYNPVFIGESMQSLANQLPCCWIPGVDTSRTYEEQKKDIEKQIVKLQDRAAVNETFQETSAEELAKMTRKQRDDEAEKKRAKKAKDLVIMTAEAPEQVNAEALPLELRMAHHNKRFLGLEPMVLNVQKEVSFGQKFGETIDVAGKGGGARPFLPCNMEKSTKAPFIHDFSYQNVPLLRNHGIIDLNNKDLDWNYQPNQTFGFIRCTYKLTDGWDPPALEDELPTPDPVPNSTGVADFEEDATDEEKFRRSFGLKEELNRYAFDEKKLVAKFKSPQSMPPRVRIQVYIVKAVCVFGTGGSVADPYCAFEVGPYTVSCKNMAQPNTNTPSFYITEARDVVLPDDSRLEISVINKGEVMGDALIGSTVINLEDRWHSVDWTRCMAKPGGVPAENRALYTPEKPGTNRGSIEMWIEMVDITSNTDYKPSTLVRPKEIEIEVRIVIWTADAVEFPEGATNGDLMVETVMNCKEYMGEHYATQETDVHYNSAGDAIWNWRMVYPKIRMPTESCVIDVNLYHYQLIQGHILIGTVNLDLKKYLEKVTRDLDGLEIGPSEIIFQTGLEPDIKTVGKVVMSGYVMTKSQADTNMAGLGRDEPNQFPQLITPTEGRGWGAYLAAFGFSLPDFGLWKKLIPVIVGMMIFLAMTIALKNLGIM